MSGPGAGPQSQSVSWRQFVQSTYPDALTKAYCVPPIHFNRVPYSRVNVPGIPTGLSALVQEPPITQNGSSGVNSSSTTTQADCSGVKPPFSTTQAHSSGVKPSCSTTQGSGVKPSFITTQADSSGGGDGGTSSISSGASAAVYTVIQSHQSPVPSTSGPAGSVSSQPVSSTSGPAGSVSSQPVPSTSGPAGSVSSQPVSPTSGPAGSVSSQPVSSTSGPAMSVSSQPVSSTSGPAVSVSSQPVSSTSGPAESVSSQPVSSTSGPAVSVSSQPVSSTSGPAGSVSSQPVPSTSGPAVSVSSQPVSSTSGPAVTKTQPLFSYSLWPTETIQTSAATPTPLPPAPIYLSDTMDDFCQQYLLHNLHALAKHLGEPMFILSSVNFQNYLSGVSPSTQFPRPKDPRGKDLRGDFDFLVIHRRRGLLVGELKSVGSQREALQLSEAVDDRCVVKRVDKAVKQLDKGKGVVGQLMEKEARRGQLHVSTALFLPYVSRVQLLRVLRDPANSSLLQKVCSCLDVNAAQEAVDMTLCSDDISDPNAPWDVTPDVMSHLTSWWQRRMPSAGPRKRLTNNQYLDLIGRFVGPATTVSVHCNVRPRITVEVRTEGEAVAQLGMALARIVLTLEQVDLLNRAPPRVFITGPPGTGKSVLLILMALVWLHKGWNVQVISTFLYSLPACTLVYHQIQKTLESDGADPATVGKVRLHSFNFYDTVDHGMNRVTPEKAAREVTAATSPGTPVCLVMDEAAYDIRIQEMVTRLFREDPDLHLWAANVQKECPYKDPELQVAVVSIPLRSAPCVVRQVQQAIEGRHYHTKIEPYSTNGIPSPADGLKATDIYHDKDHHTPDPESLTCRQCGLEVAAALRRLGVGQGRLVPSSPDSLQYRDVLILQVNNIYRVMEEVRDLMTGSLLSPAADLVSTLRDEGIPVCVIEEPSRAEIPQDAVRCEKHRSNGCSLEKDEDGELMRTLFYSGEEEEETPFEKMASTGHDLWRLHFEECDLESPEFKESLRQQREKARQQWTTRLQDMATGRHDQVIVTSDRFVQGLERKVVVALMRSMEYENDPDTMQCVSRCTTHLINVFSVHPSSPARFQPAMFPRR